mmetsp:Transcript_103344/g.183087  ORF Transcript_103344/g.183087 Transcript_103344/m.183087 type:complete len:433 (-) Transcript_103344:85-1383(-)
MGDKMGEQSAMNRLKKASRLGFGPLVESQEKPGMSAKRPSAADIPPTTMPNKRRSRSRSPRRNSAESYAAVVAVREQQERRREALRAVLKSGTDEPDLDGFLGGTKKTPSGKPAPKSTGSANSKAAGKPGGAKMDLRIPAIATQTTTTTLDQASYGGGPAPSGLVVPAPKLDLKISSGTTARALAAESGARPKAAMKAPAKIKEAEELRLRQIEEKVKQDFQEMQKTAQPGRVFEEDDGYRSPSEPRDEAEEELRQQKRDEKRKREEWRKKWREQQKRREAEKRQAAAQAEDSGSDEEKEERRKEQAEAKMRAQTWRTINNNGRYSKVAGTYVGQLTDKDLDKRLQEAEARAGAGPLMTEAEVLAKMRGGPITKTKEKEKKEDKKEEEEEWEEQRDDRRANRRAAESSYDRRDESRDDSRSPSPVRRRSHGR